MRSGEAPRGSCVVSNRWYGMVWCSVVVLGCERDVRGGRVLMTGSARGIRAGSGK